MRKIKHAKFFYILVFVIVVSLVLISLNEHGSIDKDKAISDFLEAVGYEEIDFEAKDILANPAIVEVVEKMIEASLKYIEFAYIHAESSLDDNLSAKGHIQLSHMDNFVNQFMAIDNENIYSKEFGKGIIPFGDSNLKWWNPVQTTSSRTIKINRLKNSLKILITPIDNEKAEVYICWFEI